MQASVRLEHQLLSIEGEHEVHAMLDISVPAPPEDGRRPPLRLALVLDRSGSMHGEKLAVAKRCAAWLVERLRPHDEFALVDYDDQVRLLAPLARVEAPRLRAALDGVWPGGSTNLSGGWLKGLEQLVPAPADGPRKILLLTDGLANVGITDRDQLVALARAAGRDGMGTSTIGFGRDFDEDLLTAMSDAGGGNAHYAETPDAAPAIFAEELEGLTKLVAQNVSVEIRPSEHVDVLGVLNDYPSVAVPGGVQIELGDAYGGERRRVVFALRIGRLGELGVARVADLVLRYVSVGDEIRQHETTIPVAVNLVSASEAASAEPDLEVREEVLVLKAARARDEAVELADRGDHEAARRVLHDAAGQLRLAKGALAASRAEALEAEALALDHVAPLMAAASYDANAAVRKNLRYQSNAARRGRGRETLGGPPERK